MHHHSPEHITVSNVNNVDQPHVCFQVLVHVHPCSGDPYHRVVSLNKEWAFVPWTVTDCHMLNKEWTGIGVVLVRLPVLRLPFMRAEHRRVNACDPRPKIVPHHQVP